MGIREGLLRLRGERVVFRVEDSGIGIPGDRLAAALNDFEQVHDPCRGTAGVGLGLVLCRRLVAPMGATLHLQSRVAGGDWACTADNPPPTPARAHGTVVWFELDLRRAGETVTAYPARFLPPTGETAEPLHLPPATVLATLGETLASGDVQALQAQIEALPCRARVSEVPGAGAGSGQLVPAERARALIGLPSW